MAGTEITGAIATIAASAVTGVVALLTVHLTNRGNNDRIASQLSHEKQIARAELMREKGEELYELASEWQRNISTQCVAIHAVMRGDLTYNQALDLQNEAVTRGKHYRIHLLAQAYFPDITGRLSEVEEKVEAVSKLRTYHKAAYQTGEASAAAAFLRPFTDANLALSDAMDVLKGEIAARVGSL